MNLIHTDPSSKAESLIPECRHVASLMRRRSAMVTRVLKVIQVGSVLVGIAGVTTNLPGVASLIGPAGVTIASSITAIALVGSAIYYAAIGANTPERYTDHSKYIGSYADKLEEVLGEKKLAASVKTARLQELIRLASWNLRDAKDKWPWIESRLPKLNHKAMHPSGEVARYQMDNLSSPPGGW